MPKPLFPLKHDFYASLDRFIHCAGMLADVARIALDQNCIDARVAPVVKERLEALESAMRSNQQ
jgi:hypothetical protein